MRVNFSTEQYRQMSAEIVKDKFIPFLLGLIVTIAGLTSIISRFPTRTVYRYVHNVEDKVLALAATKLFPKGPGVTSIDLSPFLSNSTPSGTMMAAKPSPVVPTAMVTITPVQENGQISAITSSQVTITTDTYVVQENESLSDIAAKAYGDGNMWPKIAEANGLASPDLIEVGMKLKIPRN